MAIETEGEDRKGKEETMRKNRKDDERDFPPPYSSPPNLYPVLPVDDGLPLPPPPPALLDPMPSTAPVLMPPPLPQAASPLTDVVAKPLTGLADMMGGTAKLSRNKEVAGGAKAKERKSINPFPQMGGPSSSTVEDVSDTSSQSGSKSSPPPASRTRLQKKLTPEKRGRTHVLTACRVDPKDVEEEGREGDDPEATSCSFDFLPRPGASRGEGLGRVVGVRLSRETVSHVGNLAISQLNVIKHFRLELRWLEEVEAGVDQEAEEPQGGPLEDMGQQKLQDCGIPLPNSLGNRHQTSGLGHSLNLSLNSSGGPKRAPMEVADLGNGRWARLHR
ncbi:protein enabled homolog [Salvelinus fontinalis]|uniref:protein enabled homolog n=1 Tax=Salvelinus fontinalis TaxID=8038 RepID=UPI002486800B|nr:protein enabled homolog [Salvelinus fontinalis]